ncbi:MAG: hypothetical protein HYU27_07850 [Acidobacteria bacterium]|nr:hypothetical protein [Acidobacteriota bacterium]
MRAAFLDPRSVQMIRSMLADRDEEIVIYAIDVAAAIGRADLIGPELLGHASPNVRSKALELVPFDQPEIVRRLLADPDTAVRVKVVARICELEYKDRPMPAIQNFFNTGNVKLRVAAAACFSQHCDRSQAGVLRQMLTSLVEGLEENREEWKDIAEGFGHIRHPVAVDFHLSLLRHSDPGVKKRAIVAAGESQHRELAPFLIRLLPDTDFGSAAREALQNYKTAIVGTLGDVLHDANEDLEVRRQIPLVLAGIPHQATVNLLLEDLFDEDGLLRFRVISALNKLRVRDDKFHFDRERIERRIAEESAKILQYERDLALLYPDERRDLCASTAGKGPARKGKSVPASRPDPAAERGTRDPPCLDE